MRSSCSVLLSSFIATVATVELATQSNIFLHLPSSRTFLVRFWPCPTSLPPPRWNKKALTFIFDIHPSNLILTLTENKAVYIDHNSLMFQQSSSLWWHKFWINILISCCWIYNHVQTYRITPEYCDILINLSNSPCKILNKSVVKIRHAQILLSEWQPVWTRIRLLLVRSNLIRVFTGCSGEYVQLMRIYMANQFCSDWSYMKDRFAVFPIIIKLVELSKVLYKLLLQKLDSYISSFSTVNMNIRIVRSVLKDTSVKQNKKKLTFESSIFIVNRPVLSRHLPFVSSFGPSLGWLL